MLTTGDNVTWQVSVGRVALLASAGSGTTGACADCCLLPMVLCVLTTDLQDCLQAALTLKTAIGHVQQAKATTQWPHGCQPVAVQNTTHFAKLI